MADVAYVPFESSDINIVDKAGNVPPYEDASIKFQGKYKQVVNENRGEFLVKNQYRAKYTFNMYAGVGSYDIPRTSGKRFICTGLLFNAIFAGGKNQIRIKDGATIGGNTEVTIWINYQGNINFQYDYSSAPLIFDKDDERIAITTNLAYGANDEIYVTLIGFEEDL